METICQKVNPGHSTTEIIFTNPLACDENVKYNESLAALPADNDVHIELLGKEGDFHDTTNPQNVTRGPASPGEEAGGRPGSRRPPDIFAGAEDSVYKPVWRAYSAFLRDKNLEPASAAGAISPIGEQLIYRQWTKSEAGGGSNGAEVHACISLERIVGP